MFWENFKEWIYRKRMIKPSPLLETLAYADCIINPKFVVVGKYVFLDCDNDDLYSYEFCDETESEQIETEALENHVHLFDSVKKPFKMMLKKFLSLLPKTSINAYSMNFLIESL